VRDVWTGKYPDAQASRGRASEKWADEWVCTLQQYTGAIMAKSIEDTFFYRYVRLFGANEVGHHPAEFGLAAAGLSRGERAAPAATGRRACSAPRRTTRS
jgi:maltooligosyltrehalose synthase